MPTTARKMFATGFLGLALALTPQASPLFAQAGSGTDSSTVGPKTGAMGTTNEDTRPVERRDNGFDLGWLGLAGLAGLLGLRPRQTHPVATTSTHRTGDSTSR